MYFLSRKSDGGGSGPSLDDFLCGGVSVIDFPRSPAKVPGYCFYDMANITKVTLHENISELGDSCFYSCRNLNVIEGLENVRIIRQKAFYNTGFTEFSFPEGATSVGSSAIGNSIKLERIILPNSMTVVPNSICEYCRKLSEAVLGENVTDISNYAFNNCQAMTGISLPSTLKTVGASAFSNTALTEVTIPAGVIYIGYNAFNSSSISRMVFENPNGWVYNTSSSITNLTGTEIDLSDPEEAATYLKSTYVNKYFHRREE